MLQNGPTWTTGKSGTAVKFDGSNDTVYVSSPTALNTVKTGVTVSAWVYRTPISPGISRWSRARSARPGYEHYYLGFKDGKYQWFVNTSSGYSNMGLGAPRRWSSGCTWSARMTGRRAGLRERRAAVQHAALGHVRDRHDRADDSGEPQRRQPRGGRGLQRQHRRSQRLRLCVVGAGGLAALSGHLLGQRHGSNHADLSDHADHADNPDSTIRVIPQPADERGHRDDDSGCVREREQRRASERHRRGRRASPARR